MTVRTISDGLVKVTGTASVFCGLWHRCKASKYQVCKWSGKFIDKGDLQYRPITNSVERGQRIRADVMEQYAKRDDELFKGRTP